MAGTVITGARGFIGSHLMEGMPDAISYDLVDGQDIRDQDMLYEFMKKHKPKIVIHLAANATVGSPMFDDVDINIMGTMNLLQCCKEAGVKHIIFTSSSAVYGNVEGVSKENTPLNPISSYGMTKATNEKMIELFCKEHKIKYTILRLANVYGLRGRGIINKIISNPYEEITIYGGEQTRDFIHVKDVVDILKNVEKEGIFNICTGEAINIHRLLSIMGEVMKQDFNTIQDKYKPEDIKNLTMSNKKMRQKLEWEPKIELKQGIKKLWEEESSMPLR